MIRLAKHQFKKNNILILSYFVSVVILTACSATPTEAKPDQTLSNCERDSYACSMAEVNPEILQLEGSYVDTLNQMLQTSSLEEALIWIRQQEKVVEAEADESSLYFRLEASQPVFILQSKDTVQTPIEITASDFPAELSTTAIVGEGTERENKTNRKKALFLEPFKWQFGDRFGEHVEELRKIPDYNQNANDIVHLTDTSVIPESFQDWTKYDAIFVTTHGGQWSEGTWIATGIKKAYDPSKEKFWPVCKEIGWQYKDIPGAKCGIVEVKVEDKKVSYVVVGLLAEFFQESYGKKGGLKKAIVYMGGCKTLTDNWDLPDALSGTSSVYFGWDDTVTGNVHEPALYGLLYMLIYRGTSAQNALDVVCLAKLCKPKKDSAELKLYANGASNKLRLYDLPTLKNPKDPTSTLRLEEGASLEIQGLAGDGETDELELHVDITGVIDPNDTADVISVAQTQSPADLYYLKFFIDDKQILFDNLGKPQHPKATVNQIDDETFRYKVVAPLNFDLSEAGQEVKLRVEVELPEGGKSDYEVNVQLVGQANCYFNATLTGGSSPYAGTYEGYAAKLGNGLILPAIDSDWEAVVALPEQSIGTYPLEELSVLAARLDDPDNPGQYIYFHADMEAPQAEGSITITQIDSDFRTGFVEGNLTGRVGWTPSRDEYAYLDVTISFRALAFSVSSESPYQQCLKSWKE